jgi:type II secretory pathway pseudopilin PulG
MRRAEGFSLVELVIAVGLTAVVLAAAFSAIQPATGLFAAAGESGDMQQRVRAAALALRHDLLVAGAGEPWGAGAGPLFYSRAPILPYRATPAGDSPGSFRSDAITLIHVPSGTGGLAVRAYFTLHDQATDMWQLVRDDGDGVRTPVINHVAELSFEYFGDPQPPIMRRPLSDPLGPWTSYGPAPAPASPLDPAGDTCIFVADGSDMPVPRLPALVAPAAGALVALTAAELTDGPWCPDPAAPDRYDADLLRIRAVRVVLRVETAAVSLRGAIGPLFMREGVSAGGAHLAPDLEVRFEVAPRNLHAGR